MNAQINDRAWCMRTAFWLLALAFMIGAAHAAERSDHRPAVAAASDLKFAVEEIAERFKRVAGVEVRLSFGSSGNFYQQILRGAPYEVFMSADEDLIYKLADAGRTVDRGALYGVGRLVLFAPANRSWQPDGQLAGLARALDQKTIRRFAIANPEHAPYGRAAEQTLRGKGLWESLRPLLVYGENVSQAAQFATSGSTDGGIFAYSLALNPGLAGRGTYVLVPEELHGPLRQRMALMKEAGPGARAFYEYLRQREARDILQRYGFTMPQP